MATRKTLSLNTNCADLEAQKELARARLKPKISNEVRSSTAYLDGVRGIAALCVFNQHLLGPTGQNHGFGEDGHYQPIYLPFVKLFFSGGTPAVSIFFVLSGFVLSQGAISRLHQPHECRAYLVAAAIRRPFRLYLPCLAVSLMVVILMHMPYELWPEVVYLPRDRPFVMDVLQLLSKSTTFFNPFRLHATTFLSTFWPYNRSLWTIPMEMKGSIVVYCCLAALTYMRLTKPAAVVMLTAVTVLLVHKAFWWQGSFTGGILLAFLQNSSMPRLPDANRLTPGGRSVAAYCLFILGLYFLSEPFKEGDVQISANSPGWGFLASQIPSAYDETNHYRFWMTYGAILCIFSLQYTGRLRDFFCTRPVQYLGKVSFMVYIFHEPIFFVFANRWSRILGQVYFWEKSRWYDNLLYVPEWGLEGMNARWLAQWAVDLTVTLIVAHFATRYLDETCVRLSKHVPDQLTSLMGLARRRVIQPCVQSRRRTSLLPHSKRVGPHYSSQPTGSLWQRLLVRLGIVSR